MVRPFRIVATGLAALALVLAPAVTASAHSTVEDTLPRSGAVLTELPDEFFVKVNEQLLDLGGEGAGFVMAIRDSDGLYYGDACTVVDGDTMRTPATLGEPGDYAITWQLISADGHPLAGSIEFEWAPEGDYTVTTGTTGPGACASPTDGGDDTGSNADSSEESDRSFADVALWVAGGIAFAALGGALIFVLVQRARRAKG